ncbi:MAG: tetratricopeptide repeat protein [Candidatus Acidiferrales bacterium]
MDALEATPEDSERLEKGCLPFESIMEAVAIEASQVELFRFYKAGTPCTTHLLFARLARAHKLRAIFTTNFDLLLERALEQCGMADGRDHQVHHDPAALARIDWDSTPVQLVKLHGSVHDRESMAITLRQVAGAMFHSGRLAALGHLFADGPHQAVLVLGYSASDRFDLNPAIAAHAQRGKTVYFVEHARGAPPGIKSAPLSGGGEHWPFRDWPTGDRLICDANWLVGALWSALVGAGEVAPPPELDSIRASILESWKASIQALPADAKAAILATWFFRLSEFSRARALYEQAFVQARWHHRPAATLATLLCKRGTAERNLGRLHEAVADFRGALALLGSGLAAPREEVLAALAGGLINLGREQEAVPLLEQAALAAHERSDLQSFGENLGLLAEAYWRLGDLGRAFQFLITAIGAAEQIGDLRGLNGRLGNLCILHLFVGQWDQALAASGKAMEIAQLMGDLKGVATQLGNLGEVLFRQGRPAEAGTKWEEALRMFREFGDVQNEARVAGNLGRVHEALGRRDQARECYEESLRLAREIGDAVSVANAKKNLGHLGPH